MIFQYDASQEKCPLPLVNLRLLLKKMQSNDVCIIKISDNGSIEDIPKLLIKLGYEYHLNFIDDDVVELTIHNNRVD
ncbi:MAG: sulfurtransferase TusA family protein [Litorilituus sp.]|jgi:TusA-related sulfurtransferase|nr:sulfurtransferase TusA family protein [Litorilituus sp.]